MWFHAIAMSYKNCGQVWKKEGSGGIDNVIVNRWGGKKILPFFHAKTLKLGINMPIKICCIGPDSLH